MTQTDGGDEVESEIPSDRRRARLADVVRLEQAICKAEGALEVLTRERDKPMSREQFMAHGTIALLASAGPQRIKNFRQYLLLAWSEYQQAANPAIPIPTQDEIAAGKTLEIAPAVSVSVSV